MADSRFDIHLIADVPINYLVAVFRDHDNYIGTLPRLLDYEWELLEEVGNTRVIRERQVLGVTFMGFEAGYDFRQISTSTFNTATTPRTFTLHYRMEESLDGKLDSSEGTYYLEEVTLHGRPMTYIRQLNRTVIQEVFIGLPVVLRHFAPVGTRRIFEALVAAAQQRMPPDSQRETIQ